MVSSFFTFSTINSLFKLADHLYVPGRPDLGGGGVEPPFGLHFSGGDLLYSGDKRQLHFVSLEGVLSVFVVSAAVGGDIQDEITIHLSSRLHSFLPHRSCVIYLVLFLFFDCLLLFDQSTNGSVA